MMLIGEDTSVLSLISGTFPQNLEEDSRFIWESEQPSSVSFDSKSRKIPLRVSG